MNRLSNRFVTGKDGKTEQVAVDEGAGADNARAHGYDSAPGGLYNRRFHRDPAPPAPAATPAAAKPKEA